jgi:hypothetical protein
MPASGTRRGKSATARPSTRTPPAHPTRFVGNGNAPSTPGTERLEPRPAIRGRRGMRPAEGGAFAGRVEGTACGALPVQRDGPLHLDGGGRAGRRRSAQLCPGELAQTLGPHRRVLRFGVGWRAAPRIASPPRIAAPPSRIRSAGCRAVLSATAGPSSPRAANYLPLTTHVLALWHPGALQAELAGADLGAELRHYTRAQIWVLVPFWVAGLALAQGRRAAWSSKLGAPSQPRSRVSDGRAGASRPFRRRAAGG